MIARFTNQDTTRTLDVSRLGVISTEIVLQLPARAVVCETCELCSNVIVVANNYSFRGKRNHPTPSRISLICSITFVDLIAL